MDYKVKVKINGKDHNLQFHNVEIKQEFFSHTTVIVELGYDFHKSTSVISTANKDWLGQKMEVTIYDALNPVIKKTYKTIIHRVISTLNTIELISFSEDSILNHGEKYRSWLKTDGIGIVKDILTKAGINDAIYKAKNKSLNYNFFQQYDETDLNCLKRLARIDGCIFYNNGENFYYSDSHASNVKLILLLQEVLECSLNCQIPNERKMVGMPYDFAKHTDPNDSKITSSDIPLAPNEFAKSTYDISKKVYKTQVRQLYNETINSKRDFESFMKNIQKRDVSLDVIMELKTSNPLAVIGNSFICPEHEMLRQEYCITRLNATFSDNVYTANVHAIPVDSIFSPNLEYTEKHKNILEPARVIDNVDPQALGRVQIQYLWDLDGKAQTWARIIQAGAGMTKNGISYGTHYTPRIGDQVMVACEHGDSSHPIILGSVYHSESKPDFWSKNGTEEVLVVKTPQESRILIKDTPGKEEILIETKGSKNIIKMTLKEPKIFIEAVNGEIEIHSKNIKITADKDMEIKAENLKINVSKNMTTEVGEEIKQKSGKNTSIEVGGQGKIEVTQALNIKSGQDMALKSSMNTKIESNIKLDIKSTMVESSAAANNVIKGAIVMIN